MVYINEISGNITIPRHTFDNSEGYSLILTSNLSNSVVLINNGKNISTNQLYYKFAIDSLENLNVGEYRYSLYNNSEILLETGLLTFGEYKREVIVNNTFNKEKKQYNG